MQKTGVVGMAAKPSGDRLSGQKPTKLLGTRKPAEVSKPTELVCPFHKKLHPLNKCREFDSKPLEEWKALIKGFQFCYKCCESANHMAKDCKVVIKCRVCDCSRHPTALHPDSDPPQQPKPSSSAAIGDGMTGGGAIVFSRTPPFPHMMHFMFLNQ